MGGSDRASWTRSGRLRGLLAVIAVMVALAAGWPLVNAAISGSVPVAAGRITESAGSGQTFQITVGPGWSVKSPADQGVMTRAGTSLAADTVTILGGTSVSQLWSGLGRIALIGNAGARLGQPVVVRARRGAVGLIGGLSVPGRPGLAALFPGPDGRFAVEMIALGKPGSVASLAAALQVIRSVSFPAGSR
ncbi:MAG TPA: hypothetical protein VMI33_15250 [Streptosporangiaceae bacterium]|nr:hypothetical protein [Streptosporangiaceae bacterium]